LRMSSADSDQSTPVVSVIVPTRNSARFLARCLESIDQQTYRPIELLVVDNYSSDSTRDIAEAFGARVLLAGPERSAQVNRGAAQARGEYIYRVDSDFELEPTVVDECVAAALRGADAVIVHNSPNPSCGRLARVRKFEIDFYKYDLDQSAARFVRRDLFLAIGGYDEAITAGEDYDFQIRLNMSGCMISFVDAEALHLDEPTSVLPHLRKYYDYGRDFVHFRAKNEGAKQLTFLRPALLRNWRRFVRHPMLGAGLVGYHTAKFAAGAAGYAVARWRMRDSEDTRSR
jgi:glycosyltransferase involved in cell wall biosynthesis